MEVHRELGPGFIESVYEAALREELMTQGLKFQNQYPVHVIYKNKPIKEFQLDLVVENKIVVEMKAIKQLGDVERAQLLSYLKASGKKVGLLINFGEASLNHERMVL
ncbi:MAG: GxxExxY protein [Lentisphaeria bacterium]|nr:GxxExxY protein [Candidatus Neomarinimicrobiota bacterium]MCF7842539.1 GxxExxY protein [Lentisphaeria bacterium]